MIRLHLQRFAEKTESATPQRREEVRKEGRIPRSPELTSAVALMTGIVVLRIYAAHIWDEWYNTMVQGLQLIRPLQPLTSTQLGSIVTNQILLPAVSVLPVILLMMLLGMVTAYGQVGSYFSPSRLAPDLSRLNMLASFRRIFGVHSIIETAKSLLKLLIIGAFTYSAVQDVGTKLSNFVSISPTAMPGLFGGIVFQLAIRISGSMLFIAFLDWAYQRFQFERSIRMTKEEVKDEHRQQEGNPEMKGQIRQRGRAIAMQRMMQQVPKADVVVTNPTHFAVALKYDSQMSAPQLLAKGQDDIAFRIRELAKRHDIPLVENKPLAQTLYKTVEIGENIPVSLYQAVAEVLAYVYGLKQGQGRG